MPRTVTKQVFQYDELSPEAQEKARNWYKSLLDANDYSDVIEDAVQIGLILGIEFDQRQWRTTTGRTGYEPAIWWSLSYSQGDGACFEGRYSYAKGAAAKIKEYAPQDSVLHDIADRLQEVQKANGYKLTARCKQTDSHYTHEYTVSIEVEKEFDEYSEVKEDAAKEVTECLRRFMKWIHESLMKEDEHLNDDETVAENILANQYEFEEDGSRTRD